VNALDELLVDTGRVAGLAPDAIAKGRTQLDDAVQRLHPAGAVGSAGHAHRPVSRLASAAGVAAAVAAAAVVLALATSSHHQVVTHAATSPTSPGGGARNSGVVASDSPTVGANTIELAGYRITVPTNYTLGQADTNCTADLHLTADETKRLVTTPAPGCPLLVTSVQRALPPDVREQGVDRRNLDGTITSVIAWWSQQTHEVYLPTKLPDATTVYVTIDIGTSRTFAVGDTLLTQLMELENGLQVSPTSEPPLNGTPVDMPTVN
jgi:hypothetical protein